jgi:2,3-bisphosphoglycerate-independent phosphoglycerate mutase
MPLLFIFLDGIGLGANNPEINPFVRAKMPTLRSLLGGQPLIADAAPYHGERASLLALDATLGVDGMPQSATGQATLLTGINIPAEIGYHYGPKPNADVRDFLMKPDVDSVIASGSTSLSLAKQSPLSEAKRGETIFSWLRAKDKAAALLSAYPNGYFKGINSGKRIYSAIPLAVTQAGYRLFGAEDIYEGRALSAGFTGKFWREMLKDNKAPLYTPEEAGEKLVELAMQYDFSFFEYWASDYAGHKQDMDWAIEQLENFDGVLAGLLDAKPDDLLVLLTSDHGNMENLDTRRHTDVKVPCLLLGTEEKRKKFIGIGLGNLAAITPAIKGILGS